MDDRDNEITELHYSLSCIQRLLNPPETIAYQILSVFGIPIVIWGLIRVQNRVPNYLIVWIMGIVTILLLGYYLSSSVKILLQGGSPACLVIGSDSIGFGITEPELWFPRKRLKVQRGLAGIYLIRVMDPRRRVILVSKNFAGIFLIKINDPGENVTLESKDVISFSELKKLIEIEKSRKKIIHF